MTYLEYWLSESCEVKSPVKIEKNETRVIRPSEVRDALHGREQQRDWGVTVDSRALVDPRGMGGKQVTTGKRHSAEQAAILDQESACSMHYRDNTGPENSLPQPRLRTLK